MIPTYAATLALIAAGRVVRCNDSHYRVTGRRRVLDERVTKAVALDHAGVYPDGTPYILGAGRWWLAPPARRGGVRSEAAQAIWADAVAIGEAARGAR